MKTKLNSFLVVFLSIVCTTGLKAQFSVSPVSSTSKPAESPGLFYALPRTVLKVNVIIQKTEKLKGPYAEFAQRMLGVDDAIKQDETIYTIRDILLESFAEPDPKAWFYIEFDERSSRETRSLIFDLMSNGILLSVDDTPIGRPSSHSLVETTLINAPEKKHFTYFAEHNLYQRVDTIVRRITIDTTVIRRNILQAAWVDRNPEQKARAAAETIQKIRESRLKLISGFLEVNFSQVVYMDKQLRELEEEYLSLFTGLEIKTLSEHQLFVIPEPDARGFLQIARFSDQIGLVENGNKGEPIQLVIEPAGNTKEMGKANLRARQSNVLFYRIPETAEVSLLYKGQVYLRRRLEISQLGTLATASAIRTRFNLDPKTGMIVTTKRD